MMSKYLVLIISLLGIAQPTRISAAESLEAITSYSQVTPRPTIDENKLSELTVVRMYFIARLRRISTIISRITNLQRSKRYDINALLTPVKNIHDLTHPLIIARLHEALEQQSLAPFNELWQDIVFYRHIDDFVFIYEYTKLCIIIIKNSITLTLNQNPVRTNLAEEVVELCDRILCLPLHTLVEALDIFINPYFLLNKKTSLAVPDIKEFDKQLHKLFRIFTHCCRTNIHINNSINSTAILRRFYITQRALKPMAMLERIHRSLSTFKFVPFKDISHARDDSLTVNNHLNVQHPIMVDCVEQIMSLQSLQPLFYVWETIQEYKLIDDEGFVKEFIQVLITIYKTLLENVATHDTNSTLTLAEVITLYEQVSKLPMLKLLDMLDVYTDHCAPLLHALDIDAKKVKNVIHVMQKYWHVITPLLVGVVTCYYYWMLWNKTPNTPTPT